MSNCICLLCPNKSFSGDWRNTERGILRYTNKHSYICNVLTIDLFFSNLLFYYLFFYYFDSRFCGSISFGMKRCTDLMFNTSTSAKHIEFSLCKTFCPVWSDRCGYWVLRNVQIKLAFYLPLHEQLFFARIYFENIEPVWYHTNKETSSLVPKNI